MLSGFSHVMMFVNDFDRALRWYQGKLDCKVMFSHAPHYAALQQEQAGVRIDLHPSEAGGKDVGVGPMPYFKVENVDASLKALSARGIKIGEARSEGQHRFATFWDSEGNALGLLQT